MGFNVLFVVYVGPTCVVICFQRRISIFKVEETFQFMFTLCMHVYNTNTFRILVWMYLKPAEVQFALFHKVLTFILLSLEDVGCAPHGNSSPYSVTFLNRY